MAAFRFNFSSEEDRQEERIIDSKLDEIVPLEAKEIYVPKDIAIERENVEEIGVNGTTLAYMNVQQIEENLKTSSTIMTASTSHTDLVPAVYEGGLKVWECTIDLIEYLDEKKVDFKEKRVLEVGCGAGLAGIYALGHGALVDFQDYNDEVLERFTIPNVFINLQASYPKENNDDVREFLCKKCHFFAGDWKFLTDLINPENNPNEFYDIILTSETIYNVRNYQKLLDFCRKHLRYPGGVVYVAAKTYYFGVGGGTRSFEELVRKSNDLDIAVCKTFSEGLQREILIIKWQQ